MSGYSDPVWEKYREIRDKAGQHKLRNFTEEELTQLFELAGSLDEVQAAYDVGREHAFRFVAKEGGELVRKW